ncbi:TPA: hypothetical protein QCI33_002638, partial [Enterobacter roggenkampii]|nr:hypothetical protein [Enterobacter roggenkampii]HDR2523033.1 hypothetical protein [Enterobacter roggenkampii]
SPVFLLKFAFAVAGISACISAGKSVTAPEAGKLAKSITAACAVNSADVNASEIAAATGECFIKYGMTAPFLSGVEHPPHH